MKTDFKLQNVCGTVYSQGNVSFTADGKALLAPVGNRVSRHNLVTGVCTTFAWGAHHNVRCFDVSPDGSLMLTIDDKGIGLFANLLADVALETVMFRHSVSAVRFSNAGTHVAVGSLGEVQVWTTPVGGILRYRSVGMTTRYRDVVHGDVASLQWSHDDTHVLCCASDSTVRVLPSRRVWDDDTKLNVYATLATQRTSVVGAFFASGDSSCIVSVSTDRNVVRWRIGDVTRTSALRLRRKVRDGSEDGEEEDDNTGTEAIPSESLRLSAFVWEPVWKEFVASSSRVSCATYSLSKSILVCGMMDGTFVVLSTEPTLTPLHTLSITAQQITSVTVNPSGDWIAFASSKLHQLLVWEWRSESYVLRHQSHYSDINAVCYSSDGLLMVSGGDDAKVKVWRVSTGQCVATFKDHQGGVVAAVPNSMNAIYTASSDGTIRAFDLQRLKSFRTLTPPRLVQFASLALDPSGDILAAGTLDSGSIFLWSTQTGKYIDEFTGHTACSASLAFHPQGTFLASVSWDATCRVYDIFGVDDSTGERIRGSVEAFNLGSEGVCVKFSPDGLLLATLTYSSEITLYDCHNGMETVTSWNVDRDTAGGWSATNPNPKSVNSKRPFTTMMFSPDSATILVAGESKWICLYNAKGGFLLRKWSVSDNRSIDGNVEVYNWRKDTDAGDATAIDDSESDEEDKYRKLIKLPGASKGVHAVGKRSTRVVARTKAVWFAPGGREWCAATSCGILVYSLDRASDTSAFIPLHLTRDVSPKEVAQLLRRGNYGEALVCALHLGIASLIDRVLCAAGTRRVEGMIPAVPAPLLQGLLEAVARMVADGRRWELALTWCHCVLYHHGRYLQKSEDPAVAPCLKQIHRALGLHGDVVRMADENTNMLQYMVALA